MRALKSKNAWYAGAFAGVLVALTPAIARAQSAPPIPTKAPSFDAVSSWSANPSDPIRSWLDMVSATQAAQPRWMTPLVTVTPRLEQEFRWDAYVQHNGTGQRIDNYGGPGGARIELIPAYNVEAIFAAPSYATSSGPKGSASGWGDWPAFLLKYRLLSANAQNGDYIVTAFFQMSDPLGTPASISNNVLTAQPTLAFGKGWGDFDIQSTLSMQFPVAGLNTATATASTNMHNFGNPFLWNTAFQYHFMEYFWPQVEVNYEYWPDGMHQGLNQVLLTPGIIFGRFQIGKDSPTRPINLIFGAGYQFAVTKEPVISNNFVGTVRVTF